MPCSVLVAVVVVALSPVGSVGFIGCTSRVAGSLPGCFQRLAVDRQSSITLTINTSGQARTTTHVTKQSVTTFQASFAYRFTGTASSTMGSAFEGFTGSTYDSSGTTLAIHDFLFLVLF